MDIISRNFFRLLRAGVFGTQEHIEPMSAWKWRQVNRLARVHQVEALVFDGAECCGSQFFMQLPDDLKQQWQKDANATEQQNGQQADFRIQLLTDLGDQRLRPILMGCQALVPLYPRPLLRSVERTSIYFPFETQGKRADQWAREKGNNVTEPQKGLLRYTCQGLEVEHCHQMQRLTSRRLHRALQNITEQEFRESPASFMTLGSRRVETFSPTLSMLLTLVDITQYTITDGMQLRLLLDLGIFLREAGDRVDYVTLQEWIEQLHIQRMSQLIGTHLTTLLGFTTDEVPFMDATQEQADVDAALQLLASKKATARYYRYFPAEGMANVISSIHQSITNIEE